MSKFVTNLHVCKTCGTSFTQHKHFLKHASTNRCSSKNTVVRPVSGTDADTVLNGAAAPAMTTTSFVAAIRFPARHIVLQGESRNVYREQQQFFSKESTVQLIQWFHDGKDNKTKKVGHRVPDKDRAQSLINLGYEQRPSDLTDDVFLKKLVKRVKQWFVSYSAKSKKRTSKTLTSPQRPRLFTSSCRQTQSNLQSLKRATRHPVRSVMLPMHQPHQPTRTLRQPHVARRSPSPECRSPTSCRRSPSQSPSQLAPAHHPDRTVGNSRIADSVAFCVIVKRNLK